MVIGISAARDPKRDKKNDKKSFWFEFAEKKGVNPHKSAWYEYQDQEKRKEKNTISEIDRFCTQCGFSLAAEAKFCERCGQKIKQ